MLEPVTHIEPVTYGENQTRNSKKPSNDKLVTDITAVTSTDNRVLDFLKDTVKHEQTKQV